MKTNKKKLSSEQQEQLLATLKSRFEKNMNRHKGLQWDKVQTKLEATPEKLWSLDDMETTGGEPDVLVMIKRQENIFFMIVQQKAPTEEVFATDREAWNSRKEHKPRKHRHRCSGGNGH
jgi:hypothetical protein